MARCTATPPCDYKANGEVHDPGCPARAGYYPGELGQLYATETGLERTILDAALTGLLTAAGLDDYEPEEVTGADGDWLILRSRIRDLHHPIDVADGFTIRPGDDGGPELAYTRPVCVACGHALRLDPHHPTAEPGTWWVHPGPAVSRIGHTSATFVPATPRS